MTDDVTALVERLRSNLCPANEGCNAMAKCGCAEMEDAADTIARLSARVAELEETVMQELSDIGQEIERGPAQKIGDER